MPSEERNRRLSDKDLDRIQGLNDRFRRSRLGIYDDVVWPSALLKQVEHNRELLEEILKAIREQTDFSHDDLRLHDFGAVVVQGLRIEWSIEDRSAKGDLVEDAAVATHRVLVIDLE